MAEASATTAASQHDILVLGKLATIWFNIEFAIRGTLLWPGECFRLV